MKEKQHAMQLSAIPNELWRYILSFFNFRHEFVQLKQCSKESKALVEALEGTFPFANLDYSKLLKSQTTPLANSLSLGNCFALLPDNTLLLTDDAELYRIPLPGITKSLSSPVHFTNNKKNLSTITALCMLSKQRAVTGSEDGSLFLWDIDQGRYINSFYGHTKAINQIASLGGGRIITSSRDNTLRLWNLKQTGFEELAKFHQSVNQLVPIDDNRIVCVINLKTVGIFDITTKKWLGTPLNCDHHISNICLNGPDTLIVTQDIYHVSKMQIYNNVKAYNISGNNFHETLCINNKAIDHFAAAVYSLPDNHIAFISGQTLNPWGLSQAKKLTIYNLHRQEFVAEYPLSNSYKIGISVLEDKRLAVYNSDNKFTLFSFFRENHKPAFDLQQENNNNECMIM